MAVSVNHQNQEVDILSGEESVTTAASNSDRFRLEAYASDNHSLQPSANISLQQNFSPSASTARQERLAVDQPCYIEFSPAMFGGQFNENKRVELINYPNGRESSVEHNSTGSVNRFRAADGVQFVRQESANSEREAILTRLGDKDPGPEYHFYGVENGSSLKSNGNNDKHIIAKITQSPDNTVTVETLYPVKQTVRYLPNGDVEQEFPEGSKTRTRVGEHGFTYQLTSYPDARPGRFVVTAPDGKRSKIFDVDPQNFQLKDRTSEFETPR